MAAASTSASVVVRPSLRLSLGRTTTEADVETAATAVASAAARLRADGWARSAPQSGI